MTGKSKKSALPDLNEITGIASKLFRDLKKSISEIYTQYQEKRAPSEAEHQPHPTQKKEHAKKPHEEHAHEKHPHKEHEDKQEKPKE